MDKEFKYPENHKEKCRFCFESFKSDENSLKITKNIEKLFFEFTNLELKKIKYSQNICTECNDELQKCAKFKKDLITRQEELHELVEGKECRPKPRSCKRNSLLTYNDDDDQDLLDQFNIKDVFVKLEVKQEIEDLVNETCIVIDPIDPILKLEPSIDAQLEENSISLRDRLQDSSNLINDNNRDDDKTSSDSSQGPFDEFFKEQTKKRNKYKLKRERQRHVKIPCNHCDRFFLKEETLQAHINSVHFKNQFKHYACKKCEFMTFSASLLRGHYSRIHTKPPGQTVKPPKTACNICGLLVQKVSTHIRQVHIRPKVVFCDICGYGVHALGRLNRHMQRHISKETRQQSSKFYCDICGAVLHSKNSVKSHIKNLHQDDGKTYSCHCGKTYKAFSYLKIHQKAHEQE